MADQVDNIATPLNTDTFTRFGFSFAGWNTVADGSGTSYADAASYPFTTDGTLFAQWTALPNHTVTFDPNSGSGVMSDQVDNVATPLTADAFTRVGYNFVGWATTSGGAVAYVDVASYPFTADATLYAVWSALPMHTVKFMQNGGSGVMVDEVNSVTSPLNPNKFSRAGYVFTGWNTAPDGSGTEYVDAESFDFSSDGVLYAQYRKIALAATGVDPSPAFELAMWFIGIGVTTMLTITLIGRRRRVVETQR
ncbi:MAG TPA: InlB B-repeat-containing protein, partial [Pseudolysinimonas sp.]